MRSLQLYALSAAIICTGQVIAQERASQSSRALHLTKTLLQDEVNELPADNTAFFTAAKKVRLQLDLLAAVQDEKKQFNDALVTVVRPDGSTSEHYPDDEGLVSIEDVERGPHAIVASGTRTHGAMFYYFDEDETGKSDDAPDDAVAAADPEPTRLTMLRIGADELSTFIGDLGQVNAKAGLSTDGIKVGNRFGYQVALASDGTLYGNVLLVGQKADQGAVAGTRISILYNGAVVGSTTADARGAWQIAGLRPGIHGLVASGRLGYTAFAFDALVPGLVDGNANSRTFVSKVEEADVAVAADRLPVVLVPPKMIPQVVEAIQTYYPKVKTAPTSKGSESAPVEIYNDPGVPIGPTMGGLTPGFPTSMANYGAAGLGGGFSGAGPSSMGGGLGGLGGIGALASLGAVAASSSSSSNSSPIAIPGIASASRPTSQTAASTAAPTSTITATPAVAGNP